MAQQGDEEAAVGCWSTDCIPEVTAPPKRLAGQRLVITRLRHAAAAATCRERASATGTVFCIVLHVALP